MFAIVNIKHEPNSAYHQSTNEKVKIFNDFLDNTLSTVFKDNKSNWDDCIVKIRSKYTDLY